MITAKRPMRKKGKTDTTFCWKNEKQSKSSVGEETDAKEKKKNRTLHTRATDDIFAVTRPRRR